MSRIDYIHQIEITDVKRIEAYSQFFSRTADVMNYEFIKLREILDEIKELEEELNDGKSVDHVPDFNTEYSDDPVSHQEKHKESLIKVMMMGLVESEKSEKDKGFNVRPIIVKSCS
jgi:hypothetical protein